MAKKRLAYSTGASDINRAGGPFTRHVHRSVRPLRYQSLFMEDRDSCSLRLGLTETTHYPSHRDITTWRYPTGAERVYGRLGAAPSTVQLERLTRPLETSEKGAMMKWSLLLFIHMV